MEAQKTSLPKIGEAFDGGKFVAVLTNKEGELYTLTFVARNDKRLAWQSQMDWAASLGCDLLAPTESQVLLEHLPADFGDKWIWLNKPSGPDYAWLCSSSGHQLRTHKGAAGACVAVRRLPLESFDPLESARARTAEEVAKLRASAQALLAACDAAELA